MNFGFKAKFYSHIYMYSGETPVVDNLSKNSGPVCLACTTENTKGDVDV